MNDSEELAPTVPKPGACGSGTCDGSDPKAWCASAGKCGERLVDAEAALRDERLARAWNEGASEGLRTPKHLGYWLSNPYQQQPGASATE